MRAYSYRDAVDSGLEPERYVFLKEAADIRAYLDFRIWGKIQNLQCYFTDADTGNAFIVSAFSQNTTHYTPQDKGIDFGAHDLEDGLYRIITGPNRKGRITWLSAELLSTPEAVRAEAFRHTPTLENGN